MRCVSISACGQTNEKAEVVRLFFGLVSRPIAAKLAALGAFMHDDKPLSRIGLYAQGHHFSAAFRGAVTGIDVQVKRPEAEGAMVAGAVAERLYLPSAIGADKGGVIFCKAFLFHKKSLSKAKIQKWVIGSIRKIGGAKKEQSYGAHKQREPLDGGLRSVA